ncbi:hypothetical protein [Gulosibacter sediminis]|uniref:hypothetical protein n=1 Tax=Gulosibacter sediminis TaxID=1729695 RepID=UPI001868C1B5|nr:hypothetical protein [Gulosibacter sediminis]
MGRRNSRRDREFVPLDLDRIRGGLRRTEARRGREYTVQQVSAERALKVYTCPACNLEIPIGQAHVVVFSADNIMGDDAAIADRRHWHSHCWRIA